MKYAALLLLLCSSACTLRAPRLSAQSCSSNRECDSSEECFLGECRGRSASLSQVFAEVRPPSDSQLGMMQRSGIDLRESVIQDFKLEPPFNVSGTVRQELQDGGVTPVAAAQIVFTSEDKPLPDRIEANVAKSDLNGGYSMRVPAGEWDIAVVPPAPLPPVHGYSVSSAQGGLELRIPKGLVPANGALTLNGATVDGARVTAVDTTGQALSAAAVTDAGSFSLLLPPGTAGYSLQVGPATDADGGLLAPDLPSYDHVGTYESALAASVALTAPPTASLAGVVKDVSGAPIAGARVYAVNTDPTVPWKMLRSVTTDSNGNYGFTLREGAWIVEAVPSADPYAPAISNEIALTLTAPGAVQNIVCPSKVSAGGLVLRPDGRPVGSGYAVNATRLPDRVVTGRTAWTVATDSAGIFHLIGDRGTYRVEIVPPASTGFPRKIVQVELAGSSETSLLVQLPEPVEVVGTVHGAPPGGADAPISGATVDFFALDASGTRSVLLGTGVTDTQGRFRAILPDVPSPGLTP